jgi:C_GCAxxG_C_C family probable redox protein
MNKQDRSIDYFRKKFNCSQAVFTVFGTENGLAENECLKIGCGFGGGIGRQQLTCGAVTGAVMAIGLKYGKAMGDPEEKKSKTYALTQELFAEFKKLHGTTVCRELLKGFDMNDPDDHKRIMELGLFEKLCEKYVSDSVTIAERIMK